MAPWGTIEQSIKSQKAQPVYIIIFDRKIPQSLIWVYPLWNVRLQPIFTAMSETLALQLQQLDHGVIIIVSIFGQYRIDVVWKLKFCYWSFTKTNSCLGRPKWKQAVTLFLNEQLARSRQLKTPVTTWQLVYTLCLRKKQDTKLLPITSPNVNWFSKFFYCQTHWKICNKLIFKYSTTP